MYYKKLINLSKKISFFISLFIIITSLFSISILANCNFDENMCPTSCEGDLVKAKVSGIGSGGYGTLESLICEYDLGKREGSEFSDYMEISYYCFKSNEDAKIWAEYYKQDRPEGPRPFCTGQFCNQRVINHHWMGTLTGYSAIGNYFTIKNIGTKLKINFNEQERIGNSLHKKNENTISKETAFKIIESKKSCQLNLKEPLPFKGKRIKLQIKNHPLKNLKIKINEKIYSTNDKGEIRIPENGETNIEFTYFKNNTDYFSIFVINNTKPFSLNIITEEGQIIEEILTNGNENISLKKENLPIENFNLDNTEAELYSTAKRYIYISEALEFYQKQGIKFKDYLKIITYIKYEGIACYIDNQILIDKSKSPIENTWSPFLEFHEFSHYAMQEMYGQEFYKKLLKSPNHGGFANPTTTDSWIEGFAILMPVIIANNYNRWWAEIPSEKRDSFYPLIGSIDANYKPWDEEGKTEEYAIASFLWDLIDKNSISNNNYLLSDLLYSRFFKNWDHNEDNILTTEEIYTGELMDNYAKTPEEDYINWYFMIELGKNLDNYFNIKPNIELFDKFDSNKDETLNYNELKKLASKEFDDENEDLIADEWLIYYDSNKDGNISIKEGKNLLKGFAIIKEISNNKKESNWNDVKKWTKDKRIIKYLNDKGLKPTKNEMTSEEFSKFLLKKLSENDDDKFQWEFQRIWEITLKKKHENFNSVLEDLYKINNNTFNDNFQDLLIKHGMYQSRTKGNKRYDFGEAYIDANNNSQYDKGETFIDYPISWEIQEGDEFGSPSNYERLGRKTTQELKGHYLKVKPNTEYEISILIKDDLQITDFINYIQKSNSEGILYIPIPPNSQLLITEVNNEENSFKYNSKYFKDNYEEIIDKGFIGEIENNDSHLFIYLVILILAILLIFNFRKKKEIKKKKKEKKIKNKDKNKK